MRNPAKTLGFLAACVAVSATTWVASTRLIARDNTAAGPATVSRTSTRLGHPDALRPPVALRNAKGIEPVPATMTISALDARLDGGRVRLSAGVTLADNRSKEFFVWRVKALDASHGMLDHRVYTDQVFRMEPDGEMQPTFTDSLPVPGGTKYVSLSLYSFNEGEDISIFDSEEVAEKHVLLRRVKRVAD